MDVKRTQSEEISPTSNAKRLRRGEKFILRVAEFVFATRGFQGAKMTYSSYD